MEEFKLTITMSDTSFTIESDAPDPIILGMLENAKLLTSRKVVLLLENNLMDMITEQIKIKS